MLVFPNGKINLGLHVVNRRPDGFHNIETVFYPVNWCDALEVIEDNGTGAPITFSHSGLGIEGPVENNLVQKAWNLIAAQKKLSPVKVHLHKAIPMGAGLGGGSADAAFFIRALDEQLRLGYTETEKIDIARQLGSDCAFFIRNRPVFASGKGDVFTDLQVDLSGYYILVVYPNIHSNTADAYKGLVPAQPALDLATFVARQPVSTWKHHLVNDFEASIFKKHPAIKALKEQLYASGALYASMSGSGSAVFGIYDQEPPLQFPNGYAHCLQKPLSKVL